VDTVFLVAWQAMTGHFQERMFLIINKKQIWNDSLLLIQTKSIKGMAITGWKPMGILKSDKK
jgi:hypothetical protein